MSEEDKAVEETSIEPDSELEFDSEDGDNKDSDTQEENEDKDTVESNKDEDDVDLKALREDLDHYKKKTYDLNKALRAERQAKKKTKDEVPEFTTAQFAELMKQHAYTESGELDFDSLTQIFNAMQAQNSKSVEQKVEEASRIRGLQSEMEALMQSKFPEFFEDGSDEQVALDKQKELLGLDDHPYGDYFAAGSLIMSNIDNIIAMAKDLGAKEAMEKAKESLPQKAEQARKAKIKESSPAKKTQPAQPGATEKMRQVAKQIGMTESQAKYYFELMKKNKNTVSI